MKPGPERRWVTAAILLGMFLAAFEATAVATAMPTAVSDLGSVERYSWAFSAYLLTSTTTVPMFGKLADLYGRRAVYLGATAIFVTGSALCGAAASMEQLILFRALQGVGAGGVMPVAITIIGDIYALEERGRMQGMFSGVWAFAGIAGPAIGGVLTDVFSWRWVFYINLPFGMLSAGILLYMLRDEPVRRTHRLDVAGTIALTLGVGMLLLGVQEGSAGWGWTLWPTGAALAAAGALLAFFLFQERRAPEPMLPLDLFRNPVIAAASLGAVVIGALLFPLAAFIPMYTQGVLGGSAAQAGATLTPMMMGWPISSTVAGFWLLRVGYRPLAILGMCVALAGGVMLTLVSPTASPLLLPAAVGVLGVGLGLLSTPSLVAVQTAVPWQRRGVATSSQQFFRTIGGAIAVAAFGALLNTRLAERGVADIAQRALDPAGRAALSAGDLARASAGLADGLHRIYIVLAFFTAAGVLVALRFPKGRAEALAHRPPLEDAL